MANDPHLERFLEEMLRLKNLRQKRALSLDELREVAASAGVSDSEWKEIVEKFKDHMVRAKGFLEFNNPDDAIGELSQALGLNPYHADALLGMAQAYQMRWKQRSNPTDKEMAMSYARECLDIDADNKDAMRLLSELRTGRESQAKPVLSTQRLPAPVPAAGKKPSAVVVVLLLIGLAVLLGMAFLLMARQAPSDFENPQEPLEVEVSPPAEALPDGPENGLESYESLLECSFVPNAMSEGVSLAPPRVVLSDYDGSWAVNSMGLVKVLPGTELLELTLKLELLDEQGKVVAAQSIKVLESHNAMGRPGDLLPFDNLLYKDKGEPDASRARVSVSYAKARPAAGRYPESKPLEVSWAFERADNIDLAVRQRAAEFGEVLGDFSHDMELEVENIGQVPLEKVEAQISWYDKSGKIAHSEEVLFTYSSNPVIEAGQVRIYSRMWIIDGLAPDQFGHYVVEILTAE